MSLVAVTVKVTQDGEVVCNETVPWADGPIADVSKEFVVSMLGVTHEIGVTFGFDPPLTPPEEAP